MRMGGTVADLEELELGYAPPYSSAKDPVNILGFTAANILNGSMQVVYAEELEDRLQDALLLDVRTQEEYADGHIPESRNLPLQTLGRTELLPPARETPLFVYCLSGVRSRQAAGLLRRMGYTDVTDLGGICNYRGKVVK